ncbi:enoyl-CoA hydratase/isomerase family protein [Croceicoccus sediminis]|uniref:enoyl-CoA hydratase/isomerase family protein n=1 Tax=Croceicoccus sediminis TaxID=2571150 RepID=UPI001183B679|nr:enoyl-CoA hydratase-related protein [Croceicoccus sediminis]
MQTEPLQTEQVAFEKRGAVGILTLQRPEVRNAISAQMAEAIESVVNHCENDPEIRACIITGSGPVFCAGADLKEVAQGRGADLVRPESGFAGFVYARKNKPWIAAVQGPAHGGGTEIALSCDMIVASRTANFALPEVKRGIIAGASGAFRIARFLPPALAIEMVATGRPIDAAKAHAFGMINAIAEPDDVLETAMALALDIAACSPLSVRETLAITRRAARGDESYFRGLESDAIATVMAGPDCREGAMAFIEKRAPQWKS